MTRTNWIRYILAYCLGMLTMGLVWTLQSMSKSQWGVSARILDPVKQQFPDVAQARHKPTVAAILVGVNELASSHPYKGRLTNLRFTTHDVNALRGDLNRLGVPDSNLRILVDHDAQTGKLQETIAAWRGKLQQGDTLIVYFAGHGLSLDNSPFLVLHDDALSIQKLLQELAPASKSRIVLWADACHSGGDIRPFAFSGDLTHSGGLAMLSATGAKELAYEDAELERGIFSWALSDVLRNSLAHDHNADSWLGLDELGSGVQERLSMRNGKMFSGAAIPAMPQYQQVNWTGDIKILPVRRDYKLTIVGRPGRQTYIDLTFPAGDLSDDQRLGIVVLPSSTYPVYYPQGHIQISRENRGRFRGIVYLGEDSNGLREDFEIRLVQLSARDWRLLSDPRNGGGVSSPSLEALNVRARVKVLQSD